METKLTFGEWLELLRVHPKAAKAYAATLSPLTQAFWAALLEWEMWQREQAGEGE